MDTETTAGDVPAPEAPAFEIPSSPSGYWRVELAEAFTHHRFVYKPGLAVTVDEALLGEMLAAGVVLNVAAA